MLHALDKKKLVSSDKVWHVAVEVWGNQVETLQVISGVAE
jgi:hypothetical protein